MSRKLEITMIVQRVFDKAEETIQSQDEYIESVKDDPFAFIDDERAEMKVLVRWVEPDV